MKRRRAITLDADLVEQVEQRVASMGGEVPAFVSAAIRRELGATAGVRPAAGTRAPTVERVCADYLQALLDRDSGRARGIVESAAAAGVLVADMYTEVFGPALAEIGHRWAMEEINVAQEHFATATTQTLMATLAPEARRARTGGHLAVVTSTPDELHSLGAQMVADLLERDGWEVLSLGAATPAADLVELVELECPDLVALSTSTAGRLHGVAEVLPKLAAAKPRPLIAVGGRLFAREAAAMASELGADLVVSDPRVLLAALRERFPAHEFQAGA